MKLIKIYKSLFLKEKKIILFLKKTLLMIKYKISSMYIEKGTRNEYDD